MRNERGPRSPSALRHVLVDVRRHGYAVEDGEVTPGFGSVGAAVLDHNGHPVASVAMTYPLHEVSAQRRVHLAARVVETARTLSRRISGTR
jgi:DNA-binding IclR family transcriptional regulator